MTAIAIGPSGGFYNRTPNSGHATAAWFDRVLKEAFSHYEQPITLDPKERAYRTLEETYDTHRRPDWDGYGALPISKEAYVEAQRFLDLLPQDVTLPAISADPRGAISYEWYGGQEWILTLAMKGTGVVVYAGLMGKDNRAYGTQRFSDSIPKSILQNILRVVP
jgi:hypothetical protein